MMDATDMAIAEMVFWGLIVFLLTIVVFWRYLE